MLVFPLDHNREIYYSGWNNTHFFMVQYQVINLPNNICMVVINCVCKWNYNFPLEMNCPLYLTMLKKYIILQRAIDALIIWFYMKKYNKVIQFDALIQTISESKFLCRLYLQWTQHCANFNILAKIEKNNIKREWLKRMIKILKG